MNYGFVKVATMTPMVRVADCDYNTQQILKAIENAATEKVEVLCFPSLSITSASCGDLYWQKSLLNGSLNSLKKILQITKAYNMIIVIGLPFQYKNSIYNCAAVTFKGELLGIVPQSHVTNRQFASAPEQGEDIMVFGKTIHFGTRQLFGCVNQPNFRFAVEIGDDISLPVPTAANHALNGANIIINLSSDPEIIGRGNYLRRLIADLSESLICGYIYANSGVGESTTDSVCSGHNLIAETGVILEESAPFSSIMTVSDIDVDSILNKRIKSNHFSDKQAGYKLVGFDLEIMPYTVNRSFSKTPFVPQKSAELTRQCRLISAIQSAAIQKRMKHTGLNYAVIGVSGGLDSTLAVLATAKSFSDMDLPYKNIIAVTMPCFGTTERTKNNAISLCESLGVKILEIDITDTVKSHFADIKQDERHPNTTFENAQARVRTLTLMDIANTEGALNIGTGNMSELALGWSTYNGDHMSMYSINSSIPKTLVKAMVKHVADNTDGKTSDILKDILQTPISPELLPADKETITQQTEKIVGPYILHDFFLYHLMVNGYSIKKILAVAQYTFKGDFAPSAIKDWLILFCKRFFNQQFKRSCMPDGPRIGAVTLSPRGGFEMPSDAIADEWLKELG